MIPRNYRLAARYLFKAASRLFDSGIPESIDLFKVSHPIKLTSEPDEHAGQVAGYLGLLHLRGEGVAQNNHTAAEWFVVGAMNVSRNDGFLEYRLRLTMLQFCQQNNSMSHYGLGALFMDGTLWDRDENMGLFYLRAAAADDNTEAQVMLGNYYNGRDTKCGCHTATCQRFNSFSSTCRKGRQTYSHSVLSIGL